MLFCKYLHRIRKKTGIPLMELAQKIGASYASARLWETGSRLPSQRFVHNLEKFYELPTGTIHQRIQTSQKIKTIYVCHPLRGGDIKHNRDTVSEICKRISEKHKTILVLSPIHNFSYISTEVDQIQVFAQCTELLSLADELWVFGNHEHSEGCLLEIRTATELKIPVIYKTIKEI